jgi:soluble cytochrome b562
MGKAGRPKNPPTPRKMLKEIIPIEEIFDEEEVKLYKDYVSAYLADFDVEDLTTSDMDDIFDLAKNKVIEFRLLKSSKGSIDKQLDVAATIEKMAKKNEKIKESLLSRRKDRVNPNEFKGFSIVDLAVAFNNEKKLKLKGKMDQLKKEEKELLESRKDYHGNKDDMDVNERDNE